MDSRPSESSLPASTSALPRLGRYQLLAKLGEGGMGEVYLARDTQLDREVALKLLPPESINDAEAVARFQREAKALAQLSHPNIVQAYDTGEEDGKHFLVMEYVEGTSLDKMLKERGSLSPGRAADYAHQAAQALQHAHEKGLIHRDLKPSNLLVTNKGVVKLLDLGLARFLQDQIVDPAKTREGTGMGTPDYASPEQFRDAHTADERSDVYSLGCTLYHLLTGQVPFPGSSFQEKYEAHASKEPAPIGDFNPEVPGGLAMIAEKMMAKRPQDRFATAAEVVDAMAPFVSTSSPSFEAIRSTSQWRLQAPTTKDWTGRSRRVPWMIASVALVAFAVTFLGFVKPGWFRADSPSTGDDRTVQKPADNDQNGGPGGAGEPESPLPNLVDPNVLTVSKEETDGGRYRTINAALTDVKPGQTVRVLDDATYSESIVLQRDRFEAVTLEATRRATLRFPAPNGMGFFVGVPHVTVRGFRVLATRSNTFCVLLAGNCTGVHVENLELICEQFTAVGVSIEQMKLLKRADPVVIENCYVSGGLAGAQVAGLHFSTKEPRPCSGIVIRNNQIRDALCGIWLAGELSDVQVVGNRAWNCSTAALRLSDLLDGCESLLIANNTFKGRSHCLEIGELGKKLKQIQFRNNLLLAEDGPDVVYVPKDREPLKALQFDHNWRQVRPTNAKNWVPPGMQDVRKDQIDKIRLDAKKPDSFLRPKGDSELAKAGAGHVEPSLPFYVGALPPEGVEPWDWERTWLAPPGRSVLLTVSKNKEDKAEFDTIKAALESVRMKPWATIRVLDDATYDESIALQQKDRYEGLMLDAPLGATLKIPVTSPAGIVIARVPYVTVRGFRIRADRPGTYCMGILGSCPGVRLRNLEIKCGQVNIVGIGLEGSSIPDDGAPIIVEDCTFSGCLVGIQVHGIVFQPRKANPSRSVILRNNRIQDAVRGIWLSGRLNRVHVVGNRVWNCESAILITDLLDGSGDLLVANNTLKSTGRCLQIGELEKELGHVELQNNLLLTEGNVDVEFLGKDQENVRALGFDHNWRQVRRPAPGSADAKTWIDSEHDKIREKIDNVNLDRKDVANLFRPASGPGLATEGAGGDLPKYIGAMPPEGVKEWRWDRTWRSRMHRALAEKNAQPKK